MRSLLAISLLALGCGHACPRISAQLDVSGPDVGGEAMDRARARLGSVRAGVRAYHDVEAERRGVLEDVTRAYRNAGYPEARAGGFEARLAPDRRQIRVTVRVDAGPRARVGRVRVVAVDGSEPPRADGISVGDWYAEDRVSRAVDRLERHYRERGHAAVVVAPRVELAGGEAHLEITVEPGPRFRVDRVVVSVDGVTETVAPAEVGLRAGDVARRSELEAARRRLRDAYGREVVFRLVPGRPAERATVRFSVE